MRQLQYENDLCHDDNVGIERILMISIMMTIGIAIVIEMITMTMVAIMLRNK